MEVAALLTVLFVVALVAVGALGVGELRRVLRGDHLVVDLRRGNEPGRW